jgi:transposase
VAWLTRAINRADAALAAAVKASPVWRAKDALLQSIPGVGPVATLTLLAGLPELGTTTGSRLAALVGLVPSADDSGARQGGQHICGGPGTVRRALYLAALSAVAHNPAMQAFNSTALVFSRCCPCGCCVRVTRSGQWPRRMARGSQSL